MRKMLVSLLLSTLCLVGTPFVAKAGAETPNADIPITEANFPDAVFRDYISQNYDIDENGRVGYLSQSEIDAAQHMVLENMNVSSVDGIQYFTELCALSLDGTHVTHVDLSNNTKLVNVSFAYSDVAEIDLSQCTELTAIQAMHSKITTLDVTGLTKLTRIDCGGTKVSELDVTHCPELNTLCCDFTQISELDLSNCSKLGRLICSDAKLTALDVTHCSSLYSLTCGNNKLGKLDVSKCTNLTELNCDNADLAKLDVSKNTKLITLYCSNNHLTGIDISKCTELTRFWCEDNVYHTKATLGEDGRFFFNTTALQKYGFDYSKVTKWENCTENNGIITLNADCNSFSYVYSCGKWIKSFNIALDNVALVQLDADGGQVEKNVVQVEKGKNYIGLPNATKKGMSFDGWYTTEGNRVSSQVKCTGDITLHAHWLEAMNLLWHAENGKSFWYENNLRQGTYDDPKGVLGDGVVRGREIFDPVSNGWYWLDSCYDGAKAINKEVWVPYVYQDEAKWTEEEIDANSHNSGTMAGQVKNAIVSRTGKWIRYDSEGKMIKGWYKVEGDDEQLYPEQKGNVYYYDSMTGLMAKGWTTIDGAEYYFDELTGVYNPLVTK